MKKCLGGAALKATIQTQRWLAPTTYAYLYLGLLA